MQHQTIFPDLTGEHASAMAKKSILLNGQKVLFDKKVLLMPVELQKLEDDKSNKRRSRD